MPAANPHVDRMRARAARFVRIVCLAGLAASVSSVAETATAGEASLDLGGPWLMKDYAPGIGIAKGVQLPGQTPRDCLKASVPGTVRQALLAAGEIPDPYFGYDNEK